MTTTRNNKKNEAVLVESFNNLITALNTYISANRKKVADPLEPRCHDVKNLISSIYLVSGKQPYITALKNPHEQLILPRIKNIDYQNVMGSLISIEDILSGLQTGWLKRSKLRKLLSPAIDILKTNAEIAVHEKYLEQNGSHYFYTMPTEVLQMILSYLRKADLNSLARTAYVFSSIIDEAHRNLILNQFPLEPVDVSDLKKPQENFSVFYQRVFNTAKLCEAIRNLDETVPALNLKVGLAIEVTELVEKTRKLSVTAKPPVERYDDTSPYAAFDPTTVVVCRA